MTPRSQARRAPRARRARALAAIAIAATTLALALTSCAKAAAPAPKGELKIVAGFYPFAYLAQSIGGPHVSVQNLTKPGAEPHDLELTPSQVASVATADLAIYEKGLQPNVDDAISQNTPKATLDVATVIHLEDHGDLGEGGGLHSADPHVWLDPVDFQKIGVVVSDALQSADPAHAADYQANATALNAQLTQLDLDYRTGLHACLRKDIVTSHAAFGYLAERYGLTQVPIAGLSPDDEPTASHLAQIEQLIRDKGVTTVFFETLASPKTAQTLASDTGTKAAVLDPIEGIADPSRHDYLSVMRDNLAALKTALACS